MADGQRAGAARREEGASALRAYLPAIHLRWLAEDRGPAWRELDATLVFADVSGFTQLGERLARRGRVGSEQLTDAITAVFCGMNDAAAAAGGEILKFGGDAVLALFSGEEHERRGCAAALGMQAALRDLRGLDLPAAVTRLRLSVGVASGHAHLFLCGERPRELVVTGPLASQVVTFEGEAQAGEVLLAPGTAAALPPGCLGAGRAGGALLEAAPPVDPPPPPPPLEGDPLAGLPAHLHDHEPDDGEHRTATVAFVQFRGADAIAARSAASLAAELDRLVGGVAAACRAWGIALVSSDVDADGGKLILAAGAPVASPDDEDRMLHALQDIVAIDTALAVRAGANRGPVFTADIGAAGRRVWSVMGDAVNLAARVMSKAEPGGVLATPEVLARTRDEFEREPVEPFTVKGKSAPVRAERIGAARGTRRAVAAAETPLVGREAELEAIRQALAAAREGLRRVLVLVGDPGLGKSRLVEAAGELAGDMDVLTVQGGPYAAHTPYLAVRGALRRAIAADLGDDEAAIAARLAQIVRSEEPQLEPWLPLLGTALGVAIADNEATRRLTPELAAARLQGAVGRLVDVALARRPTLVVVEDAHWLDAATGELLTYLFSRGRDSHGPEPGRGPGYAVLATRRDVEEGWRADEVDGALTLRLAPLEHDAARLLVLPRSEGAAVLPAPVREQLLERAGGNPLLLGELLAAARGGGGVEQLPDSVEALMTARIDTLPAADRRLLREASVLGIEVSTDLLARLLDAEEAQLRSALERLSGFLVPAGAGKVRFGHALLRDAAYGTLSFRRRRLLHGAAAEAIAHGAAPGAEPHALLAIHYGAAGRRPETWRHARAAGLQALDDAAPVEAAGFLASALEAARYLRDLPAAEVAEVAERLGDAAELAGRFADAAAAYAKARKRLAGDPLAGAALALKEGRLREEYRHLSQALRWYTRGLRLLGGVDGREADSLRARLVLAQGAARLRRGQLRECLPLLHNSAEEAEAAGDRATLAHAYYLLDWAYTDLGRPEAERYRDLALPIFVELGDYDRQARVLNNLGVNAYYECRWAEAVPLYERSREASEKAGDLVEAATPLSNIAEIRVDQGHLDEAEEMLRECLATWRAAGYVAGIGTALKNLGLVALRRGELDAAAELFERARARLASIGVDGLVLEVDAHDAERLLAAGRLPAARRLAEESLARSADTAVTAALPAVLERTLALVALRSGEREEALARLRRSAELAGGASAAYDEALALAALAPLAGGEEADAARRRAEEIFTTLEVVEPPQLLPDGPR